MNQVLPRTEELEEQYYRLFVEEPEKKHILGEKSLAAAESLAFVLLQLREKCEDSDSDA